MICREVFRSINGFDVSIVERPGRFPEERNYEVYIGSGGNQHRLLVIKFFGGRQPFYRRWVEVFSTLPEVRLSNTVFRFANSNIERDLIRCLSDLLGPGERLFIEYLYDFETRKALELGTPPHLTRLGFILFENGFTWFKDWYYPEGFMEGGPKLQAEKPIDEGARQRHLRELCIETALFAKRSRWFTQNNVYKEIFAEVCRRIEKVLKNTCVNVMRQSL